MRLKTVISILIMTIAVMIFAGCGGGGSDTPASSTRTATITLSATGISSGNVGTVDAAFNLPASGYQLSYDPTTGVVGSTQVSTTTGGTAVARYVGTTAPPTMRVTIAKGTALADGALMSITLPVESTFDTASVVTSGTPVYKDLNGSAITVSGALLSVTVQ